MDAPALSRVLEALMYAVTASSQQSLSIVTGLAPLAEAAVWLQKVEADITFRHSQSLSGFPGQSRVQN